MMSDTATGAGVAERPVDEREQPQPDPAPARKGTAPTRVYVVLQRGTFDDGEEYWTEVHRVSARNTATAIRRAARELHASFEGEINDVVLTVVPESMWRPTPVTLSRRQQVSVSIGS